MSYSNELNSGLDFSRPQASEGTGMDFSRPNHAAAHVDGSTQIDHYDDGPIVNAIPIQHIPNVNDTNRYYVNQIDARPVQDGMIYATATQQVDYDSNAFVNRIQRNNDNYNHHHAISMIEGAHHFKTLCILSFLLAVIAFILFCIFISMGRPNNEDYEDDDSNDDAVTEDDADEGPDATDEATAWLGLTSFFIVLYYFYKIYTVQHYEWKGMKTFYLIFLVWILAGFVLIIMVVGYEDAGDYESAYDVECARLGIDWALYVYSTVVFFINVRDAEREAVGAVIHPIE